MKIIYRLLILPVLLVMSCTDLDVEPKSITTGDVIFNDISAYESFLAKLYAGYSVTGQQGPAGNGDIKGLDEGFSNYLRLYWKAQELPTDEAIIGWNDGNLPSLNTQTWTDDNEFLSALYYRIFYQVSLANEFIREASEDKIVERGFSEAEINTIRNYRNEARFIRAFSYWHALDLFGNVPFFTEDNAIGATAPDQADKATIYNYIDAELKVIEQELPGAGMAPYGRADKAAVWALQSKLYINAAVYVGTAAYDQALAACEKIINSGVYSLSEDYRDNFGADNDRSSEIIFAANFDGIRTKTFGGTTFLVHAAIGGTMSPEAYGVNNGWGGIRAMPSLVDLFPDVSGAIDNRAIFYTDGQTKEISDMFTFTEGYAAPKFTNISSSGNEGSDPTHPDTDFAFFRLADVYLMYAEAVLRNGGGSTAQAVDYINLLRERAYGDDSGNISSADLTLDFMLDERARELYWEAHRRTDLIRFGKFSDKGVWAWKGNVPEGATTASFRDLYPLPAAELVANPKLDQNTGY